MVLQIPRNYLSSSGACTYRTGPAGLVDTSESCQKRNQQPSRRSRRLAGLGQRGVILRCPSMIKFPPINPAKPGVHRITHANTWEGFKHQAVPLAVPNTVHTRTSDWAADGYVLQGIVVICRVRAAVWVWHSIWLRISDPKHNCRFFCNTNLAKNLYMIWFNFEIQNWSML